MKHIVLWFALIASAFGQGPSSPYSVNLSFTASTSSGVTGYNMYRAPYTTACGTYAKLNSSPFTATTYSDNTATMGAYCYGATALAPVNGTSEESGLSNIVSNIIIPPAPPTGLGVTVASNGSGYNATLAWTQTNDSSVTHNTAYYRKGTSGAWTKAWTGTPRSTITVTVPSTLTGLVQAMVTATDPAFGESGPSNIVQGNIP